MSFGEIEMPVTEHSAEILGTSWPSQMVMAWAGFAEELEAELRQLDGQFDIQQDIKSRLMGMDGAFIQSAIRVVARRENTLLNRADAYKYAAGQARWVSNEIYHTKYDLRDIVNKAESDITQVRKDAEEAKERALTQALGDPVLAAPAIASIAAAKEADIAAIIAKAQAAAKARDAEGAAAVGTYLANIHGWQPPYGAGQGSPSSSGAPTAPMSSGGVGGVPASGPGGTPAPTPAQGGGGGANAKPTDYSTTHKDAAQQDAANAAAQNNASTPNTQNNNSNSNDGSKKLQDAAARNDQALNPREASTNDKSNAAGGGQKAPSLPPMSSPATSGGSSGVGGGSSSVLGSMMRPFSSAPMTSSPASASPATSAGGMPHAGVTPGAAQPGGAPLAGAGGGGGAGGAPLGGAGGGPGAAGGVGGGARAGVAGASRGVSAAGLGAGIADSSVRMGAAAVSATANAASAAGNVGSQVAQGAAAAAQAPASGLAASTTPAAAAPGAAAPEAGGGLGGAPIAMMPPTAAPTATGPGVGGSAGAGPLASNIGSGVPNTPATQSNSAGFSAPTTASGGGAGVGPAPVVMPTSPIHAVGADGETGDELVTEAADAGRTVVETLIAQTIGTGYIPIQFAVSLIWERSGEITAWLATSEGPSYIPLGVRVPEGVLLAITDPAVGQDLWEMSAAAGGADPLEILVHHSQIRDAAAPGGRVLALAASLPIGRVADWAGSVDAHPVSVEPMAVDAAAADQLGVGLHRCAVAMPWEWRQANAFTDADRLKVAARHMRSAALSGHFSGRYSDKVMRLFEERKPIDEQLWVEVNKERAAAMVDYQIAEMSRGQGGGKDPAQLFKTARASEVVVCLRDYHTAEGCADILYASRLAGAPLHPAAAVA